jgi:hypothetical protein
LHSRLQSGFADEENAVPPLPFECDSTGKVLWMSQRDWDLRGGPAQLMDLVRIAAPANRGRAQEPRLVA